MSDAQNDAKAIFLEALDCKGGDELGRFLEQACGADAALRARVEELLRAHQGAIREYEVALKIDPNFSIARCYMGAALLAKSNVAGAIRELHEALKIGPDYAEFHYVLACCLHAENNLDAAIREYQFALTIDPNCPQAHCGQGNALRASNDVEGAIREYESALNPNYAVARSSLAWSHINPADRGPDRPVNWAKRAVDLAIKERNHWNTLGLALYRAGDWKEAAHGPGEIHGTPQGATASTGSCWPWPTKSWATSKRPASGTTGQHAGWTRTRPRMRNSAVSERKRAKCWEWTRGRTDPRDFKIAE